MLDLDSIYEECAGGHSHICVDSEVLDGVPHVTGTKVTVSDVLARVYAHRSVAAVINYYDDVSEEQVMDAIAYTQRFIEVACEPRTCAVLRR